MGVLIASLPSLSVFLGNIKEAFDKDPALTNLLLDDFFKTAILKCQVCPPPDKTTNPCPPPADRNHRITNPHPPR